MIAQPHRRAEALAGAIALGEASETERLEYRSHLALCETCRRALGGEREIERTAAVVARARESEIWEPDVLGRLGARRRRSARVVAWRLFALAFLLAVAGRFALAGGFSRLGPQLAAPVNITLGGERLVLERRVPPAKPTSVAQRRLLVVHNVVQISRAPAAVPPIPAAAPARQPVRDTPVAPPEQIAQVTVRPQPPATEQAPAPALPVWTTVAKTTTTALSETVVAPLSSSAESIQIAAPVTTREAAPVGGETAINPQPPLIAYDEGAEGTAAFEVLVDERGTPTKCVITKSSGYAVLDDTVCKAAMHARYIPKLVGGRAVPGVYRDAFTFRMSDSAG